MDRQAQRSDEPDERATRLAGVMADAAKGSPDYNPDVRVVAFVYPDTGRGGICFSGVAYDHDPEKVVSDVLQSCDAILQTIGKSLQTFEMPSPGGQG